CAQAGLCLGWAEEEPAVLALNEGGADGEGATAGVEVAAAQRGEFALAQAGERGQQDERPEPGRDKAGEVEDLSNRCGGPLGCSFGAGTLDTTGIAPDQFVVNSRVQHSAQQPVRLGDHGRGGSVGDE